MEVKIYHDIFKWAMEDLHFFKKVPKNAYQIEYTFQFEIYILKN